MLLPPELISQELTSLGSVERVQNLNTVRNLQALVISPEGGLADFASLLYKGAVEVRYFGADAPLDVDNVSSWRPHMDWADFILTDAFLILHKATLAKYQGKILFAGAPASYRGIGSVLVLEGVQEEPTPWWKFWRR